MLGLIKRWLDDNDRELRRYGRVVERINQLEPETSRLDDAALAARTVEFRQRLERGEPLDDLVPEAFAVVREAARRTLGMRPFDVQLIGGLVLHEGKIAEMKTGEGKTLVATLPAYVNALTGRGVHIVTVNDYLARRDSEWMGQVFRFLGLSVGLVTHGMDHARRRAAYHSDITYVTNNEVGFDYLRDNMALYKDHLVQRDLHYAIIDEVDSILIDEARTPLIISGQIDRPTELYVKFADIARRLRRDEDYTVDEKARTVAPTEQGIAKVERALGIDNLYDHEHMDLSHYLINALRAKELMKRDVDYVVKDGQVIIVDEFTGRLMFGRRYSDGLHQAIEAKEGVRIERETQTLASITFQNLFRMYEKLAGMTGTAETEAEEFRKIYGLDVIVVPTHRPMIREDHPDVVFTTEAGKFRAVVEEIEECHRRGQPVLVGTISIEKSEHLSRMLKQRGIPHQVLNAKYHEQEAMIIAQAGRKGAVTIATNMAGRGTDIMLGGNPAYMAREELVRRGYPPELVAAAAEQIPTDDPQVLEARALYRELLEQYREQTEREREEVVRLGGLHIIGTERHESRRIDNQLRGRAGRQGDPGSSRFYVSLEDDLMRLFGSDNIRGILERLGVREDEPIESPMVTRAIENAQRKVESRNFTMRKHVLEYDDVLNQQRQVIYAQRRRVLEGEDLREHILDMIDKVVDDLLARYASRDADPEDWNLAGLVEYLEANFFAPGTVDSASLDVMDHKGLRERVRRLFLDAYEAKERQIGAATMRELERVLLLRTVDSKWTEHLAAVDDLREGIGLRAYGQRNPLLEYKFEAFEMFQDMISRIQEEVVRLLFKVQVQADQTGAAALQRRQVARADRAVHGPVPAMAGAGSVLETAGARAAAAGAAGQPAGSPAGAARPEPVRVEKIGRNDPCPCGSGKKYKKCCGRSA
ncbi:MAG: preprotein translocase subunit SecA [Bacillota bacterium]|nr:preprotein translocase subunit SecA [Bacillota bacterium]